MVLGLGLGRGDLPDRRWGLCTGRVEAPQFFLIRSPLTHDTAKSVCPSLFGGIGLRTVVALELRSLSEAGAMRQTGGSRGWQEGFMAL